ncbi:MAG: helix-turn-helix transcriptional regulator [Thermaerobacter sp.]|nr:helix-turn-helix transcriptional regulator [Thermaerobacter sp.]
MTVDYIDSIIEARLSTISTIGKEVQVTPIRELRKLRGLTQEDVAISVGISRSHLAWLEAGKGKPSAGVLEKLADYFGVATDDILGRPGRPGSSRQQASAVERGGEGARELSLGEGLEGKV